VIKCTDNHPFLIQSGYKPLRYLRESDLIATPLRLPAPDRALPERSDSCRFLGYAESDILWERIRSIEPAGEEETWDIRVPDTGNFIAEGIVVHNSGSIEAEADVVVFIYRDAYYKMKEALSAEAEEAEKEERQKRGEDKVEEAELIIAKQRNGPTGKVMVAFHPHYARFDNLAKGYGGREE
jgi:replicative DNA helicase